MFLKETAASIFMIEERINFLPWRGKHRFTPKRLYLSTLLHCVVSQEIVVLMFTSH